MMKDKAFVPKYSIVIPTRNREKYLPYAVESVLSTKRSDIELIVSNNYSSDGTATYLSRLNDSRLKVVGPSEVLPMSLHYEFALSQAVGEWVTILGDDDAVMPYLFERLDVLIERFPETSIISSERAYYFWEGCEDLYGASVVSYWGGPGQSIRSPKKDLLAAIAGMRSCFDLPQVYTSCIVKRALIERIKKDSGERFYQSIIPDMYSTVALCLAEKIYLRVEEPLFWTGTSNSSMGRSDRIYKDAELKGGAGGGGRDVPTLKLHPSVPQSLHILGIGSLYLYEALLNCPFANGFWNSKGVARLVYADVLIKTRKDSAKRGFDRLRVEKEVYEQIEANALSVHQVIATIALVRSLTFIQQVLLIPKRLLRKTRRLFSKDALVSNDRERFNTILEASRAVEDVLEGR